MTDKLVLVLDVETTGFLKDKKRENYIVEMGIVMVDLETRKKYKIFDEVIKEEGFSEIHKDAWVFENSDLTFDEVMKKGKPLSDFKDQLQDLFNTFIVTAYNTDFDLGFLEKAGFTFPYKGPCIMKCATELYQIKSPWGIKWASVEEAWFYLFDEPYIEKHRAYDDVLHESEIMLALYSLGVWKYEKI